MNYRIELRDREFTVLEFLEDEAMNIRWEYNRIGGCGAFSFALPRKFNDQGFISGDFDVRIYNKTDAGTYSLWYSGYVEDRMPNLKEPETVDVRGNGYVAQLSHVVVNTTYESTEIGAVVKDIMDTYVVPETDITYDAADIGTTAFTADTLEFNTTALNAIRTCAEIVGTQEWGVGADRKFFFKPRSSTVNFYYNIGKKVKQFSSTDSFRDIVNRILLEGGEVGGTVYTRTINDTDSQNKYGLRELIYQNSAIVTSSVADQFGEAILAERSDLVRRGRLSIVNEESQAEATVPLGAVVFREEGTRYNEKEYGTFLYSGDIEYQLNRISYKIEQDKSLTKNFDLGQIRPSISEEINQVAFELDQVRAARG